MDAIPGFDAFEFPSGGIAKTVYTVGSGPGVVLIHEAPGLSRPCIELARRLAAEGFAVYMPLLFGEAGTVATMTNLMRPCVWREFALLESRAERPITSWLRALAREAHARQGGPGVGAIGMCLTGGFALSMLLEPALLAPVVSQPSLPAAPWRRAELGLSDALGGRFQGIELPGRHHSVLTHHFKDMSPESQREVWSALTRFLVRALKP